MGHIEAICIGERKGERKCPVSQAVFRADYGIEGDAHAGPGHRQVSLLANEDIEAVRQGGLKDLKAGDFAENIILAGVGPAALGLGSRLKLGTQVSVSITQIGKVCHNPCRIYELTGDCIMPRLGLFVRVDSDGTVRVGDDVEILKAVPREVFQAVVLTISDRCSSGEAEDTAGPATTELLRREIGAHVYRTDILPDDRHRIADRLRHYSNGHGIDLVMTVGGTGFTPRDVTPEATRYVVDRLTPGLDEAMRAASLPKTPHAMLSRGVSGIRGSTLIVNLPGSQRAAVENLQAILPALAHGLAKLRGDPSECGRPDEGANQ